MSGKVLFVDGDPNILAAYRRSLRKACDLMTAEGGAEGLKAIAEEGPFAVVVSDWKMPNIDGIKFLGEVMRRSPETVRIMLTGLGVKHLAVDAVNQDYLFRFHTKPCPMPELLCSIDAGIARHRQLAGTA